MRILGRPPVYKGTISDLRISAIDGTAFIDNCSAITAYADNAHRVEIHDSAGKRLVGVLKAAGSGETLGAEMHTSANAASDPNSNEADASTGWAAGATSTSAGTPAVGSYHLLITAGAIYTGSSIVFSVTPKGVYRVAYQAKKNTSTIQTISWNGPCTKAITPVIGHGSTSYDGVTVIYGTADDNTWRFFVVLSQAGGTGYIDNVSFKQVLAPSADGIVIVNAKGGSTENWLTKDAGFAYNEASYRVIVREYA